MSMLSVQTCQGDALPPLIPVLAALRVAVFRAWPYLYDCDEAYERHYLQAYVRSTRAAIVVARAGESIVGASTCLPLADETANIQWPFLAHAIDPGRVFYFGESVLLPAYRGRGVGVAFFAHREAHARAVTGCDFAAFCAVVRPAAHPARPHGFVPLDAFWTRRGYARRPDLVCRMDWTDLGDSAPTTKELVFWMKTLTGATLPGDNTDQTS